MHTSVGFGVSEGFLWTWCFAGDARSPIYSPEWGPRERPDCELIVAGGGRPGEMSLCVFYLCLTCSASCLSSVEYHFFGVLLYNVDETNGTKERGLLV